MDKKDKDFFKRAFGLYLIRRYEDYFVRGYLNRKSKEEQLAYLSNLDELFNYYFNEYMKDE